MTTDNSIITPKEPFAYLYETKTGIRILHIVGKDDPKILAIDMDAAREYPTGHWITPLYKE